MPDTTVLARYLPVGSLDLRNDGPIHCQCELCGRPHRPWEVPNDIWDLLPPENRDMVLCELDFLRLVQQTGADTIEIEITYENRQRQHEISLAQQHPAPQLAKIHLDSMTSPLGEWMWCAVVRVMGDYWYVVRLLNSSPIDRGLQYGDIFLAECDDEMEDCVEQPPLLTSFWRLRSGRRRTRRRRASFLHVRRRLAARLSKSN